MIFSSNTTIFPNVLLAILTLFIVSEQSSIVVCYTDDNSTTVSTPILSALVLSGSKRGSRCVYTHFFCIGIEW